MQKLLKFNYLGKTEKLFIHHDNEHTKIILPDEINPLESYPFLPLKEDFIGLMPDELQASIEACTIELIDLRTLIRNSKQSEKILSQYNSAMNRIANTYMSPAIAKKVMLNSTLNELLAKKEQTLLQKAVDESCHRYESNKQNLIETIFSDGRRVFQTTLFDQFARAVESSKPEAQ